MRACIRATELQYILKPLSVCLLWWKLLPCLHLAAGAGCMMHPAQTLCCSSMSKVCPFQSRLCDLPGLGHGAWAGQDAQMPTPTQKYFAVSNEPEHGASHLSLDVDRGSWKYPLDLKTPEGSRRTVSWTRSEQGHGRRLLGNYVCHRAIKHISDRCYLSQLGMAQPIIFWSISSRALRPRCSRCWITKVHDESNDQPVCSTS